MIIDTDVIIRYLTNDDHAKANRFESFLKSGKKGQLTDVTFAEVYWTLVSFYKIKSLDALSMLEALIASPAIETQADRLSATIDILRHHKISFIDAYTAASAKQSDKTILSFDHDFDSISDIKRIEP